MQFYQALHRRGVPVETYIYPRQGHALAEPRLLADALRRNDVVILAECDISSATLLKALNPLGTANYFYAPIIVLCTNHCIVYCMGAK